MYNKNHDPCKQRFFRHRLVAEHFIPNPNGLPEVNHIDCDKSHNFVDNLEWISRRDNELHSRVCGRKEFKPFKVLYNNGAIEVYQTKSEFAKILNVTDVAIKFWLQGKNKGYKKYDIDQIKYI